MAPGDDFLVRLHGRAAIILHRWCLANFAQGKNAFQNPGTATDTHQWSQKHSHQPQGLLGALVELDTLGIRVVPLIAQGKAQNIVQLKKSEPIGVLLATIVHIPVVDATQNLR